MKKTGIIISAILTLVMVLSSCTEENDLLNDGESRDAFLGSWSVSDACSKQSYGVNISADPSNFSVVQISNFANLGRTASGVIAGTSIIVESQDVGNGYSVSGSGRLNGSIISWSTYNYADSGNSYDCTATFSK